MKSSCRCDLKNSNEPEKLTMFYVFRNLKKCQNWLSVTIQILKINTANISSLSMSLRYKNETIMMFSHHSSNNLAT